MNRLVTGANALLSLNHIKVNLCHDLIAEVAMLFSIRRIKCQLASCSKFVSKIRNTVSQSNSSTIII